MAFDDHCVAVYLDANLLDLVPNAKVKLRSTLPGAVFATAGWMLLSQVFGLYARFLLLGSAAIKSSGVSLC